MGAIEWRKEHPTYDGRGTTIAIIDQSLDALLPELQVAMTIDGKPTRKIIGYQTAVDIDDEDDGQWLRMKDSVVATDGRFTYGAQIYTAPSSGTFRIALLDEAVFDSLNRAGIEKDINRDGNPKGSSRIFAVLWNEATNDVWVDTDQNLDFTNEKAYTEYAVRPEFGVIGKDNPATPIRESISFAVQIDKPRRLVSLNLGVASHASLVVGVAVASRGTAGRFDGVAPGAQLVNMAEGGAAYGQTEAVIRAVKHPSVDVVFLEQSSVIARNYLLFDGRLVPTVIYGRLIARFGKPIVIPTHNYAVLAAIDDYALAPGAISVGAHESKANFFANHGVRVEHDDNLLITGGYGPMGNGALKPDIIAPSNYVSTGRGFLAGTAIPGLMQLPPGYSIAGGTSTATPTTAGAVALLISAARQAGIKHDAYRLRQALMTSARWVPHLEANKQGNGVVNVAGAWEALRALDTTQTITITSRGSVKHAVSQLLATPNEGVSIFEREGWIAGDRGERAITFTRTTGPKEPMTFALGWTGNDGTFSSPASVTLPLNTPVPVTVAIAPKTTGVHAAIITLDNTSHAGFEYRTLATIVAADSLTFGNSYKSERKVDVPRPGMTHLYYRVPNGATALRLDIDAPKRRVSVSIMRPDTRTVTGIGSGFGTPSGPAKATYAVRDPAPGVWEVRLQDVEDTRTFDWEQAKKMEPVPPTPVTVTVTALAADLNVTSGEGNGISAEGNSLVDVQLTSRLGAFPGAAVSMSAGSVRRDHPQIKATEQKVYDVDVPAGSTMLIARAQGLSDPASDVDLYVFDCTGKECVASRTDGDATGNESVMIMNPAAGKWKVIVDAPTTGASGVAFDYEDIVLNPAYGFVGVTDQPKEQAAGASWTTKANTWIAGNIPTGRMPYAAVLVQAQPKGAEPFIVSLRELKGGTIRASGWGSGRSDQR